jgi:hypothetical protein
MQTILDVINSADLISLIGLIVVVCWIGNWMVRRFSDLRQWAWRFAAVAFVAYCLYMGADLDEHTPVLWLGIACRGLLAAGLTLGISGIVLAAWGFLRTTSATAANAAKYRADNRRRAKERKRQDREQRRQNELWEREAPARERERKIAEAQRQRDASAAADNRRSREDARYECELFYNRHAIAIRDRFSKQDLHEFLEKYMGDGQPIDIIRRRATQLRETIRHHAEAVDPADEIHTLEGLAAWYAQQKAQIDALDVEPDFKHEFCLQLKERYTELTQRILEEVNP